MGSSQVERALPAPPHQRTYASYASCSWLPQVTPNPAHDPTTWMAYRPSIRSPTHPHPPTQHPHTTRIPRGGVFRGRSRDLRGALHQRPRRRIRHTIHCACTHLHASKHLPTSPHTHMRTHPYPPTTMHNHTHTPHLATYPFTCTHSHIPAHTHTHTHPNRPRRHHR